MFGRIVIVGLELLILPSKRNGDIARNGGSLCPVQYQTRAEQDMLIKWTYGL